MVERKFVGLLSVSSGAKSSESARGTIGSMFSASKADFCLAFARRFLASKRRSSSVIFKAPVHPYVFPKPQIEQNLKYQCQFQEFVFLAY